MSSLESSPAVAPTREIVAVFVVPESVAVVVVVVVVVSLEVDWSERPDNLEVRPFSRYDFVLLLGATTKRSGVFNYRY